MDHELFMTIRRLLFIISNNKDFLCIYIPAGIPNLIHSLILFVMMLKLHRYSKFCTLGRPASAGIDASHVFRARITEREHAAGTGYAKQAF